MLNDFKWFDVIRQDRLIGTLLQMGHHEAGFDLSALFLHPKGMLEALDLSAGTSKSLYVQLFLLLLNPSLVLPPLPSFPPCSSPHPSSSSSSSSSSYFISTLKLSLLLHLNSIHILHTITFFLHFPFAFVNSSSSSPRGRAGHEQTVQGSYNQIEGHEGHWVTTRYDVLP